MQSESNYKQVVDATNMAAYARTGTVDWYRDLEFILKPEAVILEAIGPAIKDKKLLDIGIGAGRTTRFLLEISSDYTGIDYTPTQTCSVATPGTCKVSLTPLSISSCFPSTRLIT